MSRWSRAERLARCRLRWPKKAFAALRRLKQRPLRSALLKLLPVGLAEALLLRLPLLLPLQCARVALPSELQAQLL